MYGKEAHSIQLMQPSQKERSLNPGSIKDVVDNLAPDREHRLMTLVGSAGSIIVG